MLMMGLLLTFSVGAQTDAAVLRKANKVLYRHFEGATIQLFPVVAEKIQNGSYYQVKDGERLLGYAVIDRAKGRYDYFDYLVITSPMGEVSRVDVLIYRSMHGGEITHRSWLKQFIGLQPGHVPIYSKEIDAISGSTLSARSITAGIAEILRQMKSISGREFLQ